MSGSTNYTENYQHMIAMVCYLKACKPDCLKPVGGIVNYKNIIEAARLNEFVSNQQYHSLWKINKLVQFESADENTRKKMLEEKEIQTDKFGRPPENMIKEISAWLSEISSS